MWLLERFILYVFQQNNAQAKCGTPEGGLAAVFFSVIFWS